MISVRNFPYKFCRNIFHFLKWKQRPNKFKITTKSNIELASIGYNETYPDKLFIDWEMIAWLYNCFTISGLLQSISYYGL